MTTAAYRVEYDSLRAFELPPSAPRGAQTERARQNFQPAGLRMRCAVRRAPGLIERIPAAGTDASADLDTSAAFAGSTGSDR